MILENFSAGYYLASDTSVEPYSGERAVVSPETYAELGKTLWPPFIGTVGGVHFKMEMESAVPDDTVAVPDNFDYRPHDDDVLLVLKDDEEGGASRGLQIP